MIINTTLEQKGNNYPQRLIKFEQNQNILTFYTENNVALQITVLKDSLMRVRYSAKGYFNDDFSYAIDDAPDGYKKIEVSDNATNYEIHTDKIICVISKENLKITFLDIKRKVVLDEEVGFHWEECYEYGGNIVKMTKKLNDGENFYGLGDKACHLNIKGKRFENWVTDQYGFQKDQDPLYKAIPFYIGLHHDISYGIFFDNTFRTCFDFGSERNGVTSFWADGGEMNYYFIYGPSMDSVVTKYSCLTGTPELPPMWTLGYHQCKWSYRTESEFTTLAKTFREKKIPCDAIYLDIDYMDDYKCFTWDKERFPGPKKMVAELKEKGFKTIAIIDPGIKIDKDYEIYKEGLEKKYFCTRADSPFAKGKVWPGECFFPDFTNPEVREWWAGLFKELISDVGIAGIWNDMNEPAVMEVPSKTLPNDVRHDYDGHPCSHRKAHNIYGMQMVRATYEGLKKNMHPNRPFVITRAAYSGTQRYSSTWTGDNISSWEHLWIACVQIQRMSISGYGFVGTDIGGFAEQPSSELYARWIQLGVFHPFCRTHSLSSHGDQEPWSFGKEVEDIARKFIELRYQLLPYIYTMFWEYSNRGIAMIKPLVYFDIEDKQTHYRTDEFIFGDHILVCPILAPNSLSRRMYLPKGRWYNYWTNELKEGKEEFRIECDFDQIPIFILEGSIIPKYPIQQYVGEAKIEKMFLEAYYKNGEEKTKLYEDSKDGYDYSKGLFLLRNFTLIGDEKNMYILQNKEGKYDTEVKSFEISLIGVPFKIENVFVDKVKVDVPNISKDNKLLVSQCFTEIHMEG